MKSLENQLESINHLIQFIEHPVPLKIKGPDNPTSQLLPIMSNKCCSGDGEGRKDKGCGGGSRRKTSCM